jgi:thiol-disulfide isomerase/thioredoxin
MHVNKKTKSQEQERHHSSFQLSIGVAFVALLIISLNACTESPPANSNTPVISGQPNTAFPMPPIKPLGNMGWDLGGGRRSQLSEYRGKVLVLDFYATWCDPCRASVPHLVQVQERYGSQGVQVVGLNVGGPDDLGRVSIFASKFKIQYPLGVPEDALSRFLFGNDTSIPQTFVFDRQGLLVKRLIGYSPEIGLQLEEAINSALKSPAG